VAQVGGGGGVREGMDGEGGPCGAAAQQESNGAFFF
jgi:hypothetical protein